VACGGGIWGFVFGHKKIMDNTTQDGSIITNATPTTQPFSLSDPSTYATIIPDFTGGLEQIGSDLYGSVSGATQTVYQDTSNVLDPLLKEANDIETGAVSAIQNGASYITTKTGNAINGVVSTVSGVFSFLSTPIEWALFVIVVGAGLYLFGPLLLAYGSKR
jgi:hypothetical protein